MQERVLARGGAEILLLSARSHGCLQINQDKTCFQMVLMVIARECRTLLDVEQKLRLVNKVPLESGLCL